MSQRTERIDELLRQEIGQALARDLADPAIGFATITDVETSPDLRHARVWVSVIGSDADRAASLAALRRALPYLRHELGLRLRLRRIPEFHVRLDESMERGTRVLQILQELEEGLSPEEPIGGPAVEPLPTPVRRLPQPGDAPDADAGPAEPPGTGAPTPGGGSSRGAGRRRSSDRRAGPASRPRGRSRGPRA